MFLENLLAGLGLLFLVGSCIFTSAARKVKEKDNINYIFLFLDKEKLENIEKNKVVKADKSFISSLSTLLRNSTLFLSDHSKSVEFLKNSLLPNEGYLIIKVDNNIKKHLYKKYINGIVFYHGDINLDNLDYSFVYGM